MTLRTAPAYRRPSLLITPYSVESIGEESMYNTPGGQGGSLAWPTANLALFFPFFLDASYLVDKVFLYNGTTASANFDIGVYDSASTPTRLASTGSTAQSGTSQLQEVDVSWAFNPGNYYLAIALSANTSHTIRTNLPVPVNLSAMGCAQQASAFPLPSTATFAASSNAYIPCFGISARSLAA